MILSNPAFIIDKENCEKAAQEATAAKAADNKKKSVDGVGVIVSGADLCTVTLVWLCVTCIVLRSIMIVVRDVTTR
ncbi:hypothetical protein EON65_12320 [archaeon]|nr:MAG: hypothetical protein EON65_12320 [archaeon]